MRVRTDTLLNREINPMAQDSFHPDAHPEAREITGDRDYGEWGQCIATATTTGSRCTQPAKGPHGKCHSHGGAEGSGAPEGNGNAETHGLTSEGKKWFERHRDEVGDDVRKMVAGWMREASFGYENHGNVRLLVDAAINECQIRQGDQYIREEGVVVESFDRIAEDGRQVYETKENSAFKPKSRLQRDTVRILEKLGILDDPESEKAASQSELADAVRDALDS